MHRRRPHVGLYRTTGKRVLDLFLAGVAITILAPLICAIAILIRVALGPGIWYRQERVGLDGRLFTIVKFRTMDADRRGPAMPVSGRDRRLTHKTDEDPRHTRVGRALRRSGLDELPQLINVLRGDMSLVGPRPELPHIVGRYSPSEHSRHEVRPGITGPWQITHRGSVPMHEAVDMDLAYLETVSLRGDLTILIQTIPALLRRTGA